MTHIPTGYKGTLSHLCISGWKPCPDRTSVWLLSQENNATFFIGYCARYNVSPRLLTNAGLDIPEGILSLDVTRGMWLLLLDTQAINNLPNFEDWRPWIAATGVK